MTGYDDFQVTPHSVGDVRGDHTRPPGSRISNYQILAKGQRRSQDYTFTSFADEKFENPEKEVTDAFLAHGTDWSLFEYNPYGHSKDSSDFTNPNRRRLSDNWAKVIGVGSIDLVDWDVVGGGDDDAVVGAIVQYRNYPEEGYSSFGKKGDKRWAWSGNTWVPAS